jgi:hypothetical protein
METVEIRTLPETQYPDAIEMKGVCWRDDYAGVVLALLLLERTVEGHLTRGPGEVIIYNWRGVPSNRFSRHLGGVVRRQDVQCPAGRDVAVDVFVFRKDLLLARIRELEENAVARR